MKIIVLSLLLSLVSIFTFLFSTRAGNVVTPKFKKNVSSYGLIKLDPRDDRKVTINKLKEEEEDEDDDNDDGNDDEEETEDQFGS